MNFYPEMPAPFPLFSDMSELQFHWGKPKALILPITLSAVDTATKNTCVVINPRDGKPYGLNNNIVTVGEPGTGKTVLANAMLDPILQFQQLKNSEVERLQRQAKKDESIRKTERRAFERKLSKAIENDDKEAEQACREKLEQHLLTEPTVPQKVHYVQNGLSLSGMKRELSNSDIHATYYVQEGVSLKDKLTADMIGIINPAWNNERIYIAGRYGKNDNVSIEFPHFSMLILIQGKLHEKCFVHNEMLRESGFNARCITFIADGPTFTGNPSERGRQVLKRINDRCIQLLANKEPRILRLSEQAEHMWLRMIDGIHNCKNSIGSKEAAAADFMGKYEIHILRVASLLHLLYRDSDVIETDCLYEANLIMQDALENYLRLFTDYYHPPALYRDAMDVYHWVMKQTGYDEIAVRTINNTGPTCARDRDRLETLLELLKSEGLIARDKTGKSEIIRIVKHGSLIYAKY